MQLTFCSVVINSPLGPLYALAHDTALVYLSYEPFVHDENSFPSIHTIVQAKNQILICLEQELALYFKHELVAFTTPIEFSGTSFQKTVWQALTTIPYGQTRSYRDQSALIQRPKAYRAVGAAHGANNIAIVVPCHRVIAHNGSLGGYAGGLARKAWLLEHEKALNF